MPASREEVQRQQKKLINKEFEMQMGKSALKLIQLNSIWKADYPRLSIHVVPHITEIPLRHWFHIVVFVKDKPNEVIIDEEEDVKEFPTAWLMSRIALIG